MNSEAVRLRNARKRAKSRAKKRGEVFTHVNIDLEVVGCRVYEFTYGNFCVSSFMQEIKLTGNFEENACEECRGWCKEFIGRNGHKAADRLAARSVCYILMSSGSNSSRFEEFVNETWTDFSAGGSNLKVRLTVAVTSEGQRRVKQWLVTTGEEAVVADVIAAVSTLGQSLSQPTSSNSI